MAEDREVKSLKDLEVCNQLVEAFDNLGWNLETPIQDASQSHSSCAKAPEGNPVKIEAAFKHSTLDDTLKQQYLIVPAKHKDCYLVYILTQMSGSTVLVFTRTCNSTRLLALMLQHLGLRAIPICGDMSQARKLEALNTFMAGECNILVCTDVTSRGLDIPFVDMVINYDIPQKSKVSVYPSFQLKKNKFYCCWSMSWKPKEYPNWDKVLNFSIVIFNYIF